MRLVDSQIHLFAPGAEEFATRMLQTLMPPEAVVAEMDTLTLGTYKVHQVLVVQVSLSSNIQTLLLSQIQVVDLLLQQILPA